MCEGFAHGLTAAFTGYWNLVGFNLAGSSQHQSIAGYGSGYMANVNANFCITPTLTAGEQWLYLAWHSNSIGPSDAKYIANFRLSGVDQVTVETNSSGFIVVRRGAPFSGTILATSATAVSSGVWHWFWIDCVADTVAGRVRVYLDGNSTPVVDTGITNTAGSGSAGWNQIRWLYYLFLADIATFTDAEKTALFGATFPEIYIPGVVPTSDDTNTFVSGGFAQVDEIPWSTADTANANAVGQELILGGSGLSWTPPAVYFAANTWYQERDGTVTSMASRLKSGAANVTSAAVASTAITQFSERQVFYPQNPDGPANWTWATFTAAKFGVITT